MPAGEIPKELKERLTKDKVINKDLPPLNLGGGAQPNSEEEAAPLALGEDLKTLVNENEEALSSIIPPPDTPVVDPSAQLERYKAIINQQNGDIKALKKQLAEAKETDRLADSKKFRVFLSLIQGFTAKGEFSPASLMEGGGGAAAATKRLSDRMNHAASLVSHAMIAIENLPDKHRF